MRLLTSCALKICSQSAIATCTPSRIAFGSSPSRARASAKKDSKLEPVFDREHPIRLTGDMGTWYTGKPCERTNHSHINFCVYDSTWEASDAFELDRNSEVDAWVKNDHLGFEIVYVHQGIIRKYRPDFLIRFKAGNYLILEEKGKDTDQDKTKREFLDEWVNAVNGHGSFGSWSWDVSRTPGEVKDILACHAQSRISPQSKA